MPSLTYTQSTNDLNNNLRIRGVGTALFNVGLESSVSIVVDGVVLARQGQGFQDLIDIDRVEVLRGPQGTLFGKNATAGVINVVTARPSKTFSAVGEATVAEGDEYRLRGTVSGPLTEALRGRLTAFYTDVGGHIQNVHDGRDFNGSNAWGVRGKLEWDVTPDLNLLLIADYRKSDNDCCQFQSRRTDNPILAAQLLPVVASPTNRQVNIDGQTFNRTEQGGVSLQGDLKLPGGHTLTSITAYRTWDFLNNIDVDGIASPRPIFTLPLIPTAIGQFDVNGGPTKIKQVTQELRIASPQNQRLTYVAGLYYFGLDLDRGFTRRFGLCIPGGANGALVPGAPCAAPQFRSGGHSANTSTENISLFGQAEFQIIGPLSAIAGVRWQNEDVSYSGTRTATSLFPGDVPAFGASAGSGSVSDDVVTGKAGLKYAFSRDAQAYATYSRGYKGRGFDVEVTANFVNQAALLPETVDAFELGYKANLLDRRLLVSAALFHERYENLQVQASAVVNGLTVFVPTNAGESTSKGFELEATATPMRGLTLTAGVTYLDASITVNGLNCNLAQPAPTAASRLTAGQAEPFNACFLPAPVNGANPAQRQNVNDGRLPNAPDWRATLSARYERPLGGAGWDGFVQGVLLYQDDVQFSLEQDPLAIQKAYATVDLSAGVRSPGGRYSLTVFVRNLFDHSYATSIGRDAVWATAASPNNLIQYLPKEASRYVGATFRVRY